MYKEKPEIEDLLLDIWDDEEFLLHYGLDHIESTPGSGRYRFGSGDNPYQHGIDFLARADELRRENVTYYDAEGKFGPKGKTYTGKTAVAHAMGLSSTQFRVQERLAKHEERTKQYNRATALREAGYGYSEIARKMGLPNESSVRSLLNPNTQNRIELAQNTADFLRDQIEERGIIDVGIGVERNLGISREKLDEAIYILELEGYQVRKGRIQNVTDPSGQHQITMFVVGGKDISKDALYKGEINFMSDNDYEKFREENGFSSLNDYISRDDGITFEKKFVYPESMDSSRLAVRYAEEGGVNKDGIIEIRRGVPDLSLGESTYAQVRILVDNDHYLKGMAIYSDDLPEGIDVRFNTNKSDTGNKLDALKSTAKNLAKDPDNPFGSNLREEGGQYWYEDANGDRKLGLINKTRQEGDWSDWQDKVPSQFLSKQPYELAQRQLSIAIDDKVKEYNDIMALENDTIKKYFLNSFASDCDSASVHLQAAALPRQKHQVILPIDSMKDTEVYAPNYENGEKVALVRYPHGGTFEIPILTVNNKQEEAVATLGKLTADCVGINSKVASRLSGADFDGDTVMVIPLSDKIQVKSTNPLKELEGFDPKTDYATTKKVGTDGKEHYYNKYGKEIKVMSNTDTQMGVISNLITDMTIKGATNDELARAVKHSMVVIDAEKHKLDYRSSERENRIDELKSRYQNNGIDPETGKERHGASTLISRAKSETMIEKTQGSPRVNIKGKSWYDESLPEGALIYKKADEEKLHYTQVQVPGTKNWVNAYEKNGKLMYNNSTDPDKKNYIPVTNEKTRVETRTQKSTQMAETQDARTLISEYNSPMENLYANYANTMKYLANQARKEAYETKDIRKNPVAAKTYAKEVESLNRKIDISEKNPPRERQAQVIANSRIKAKTQGRDFTKSEKKKLSDRELRKARIEVGAQRVSIDITDKEWEAIQMGAISKTQLEKILKYSDKDKLRERATPRSTKPVSDVMASRIQSMAANGRSNAEIAAALGISASTVSKYRAK